MWITQFLQFYSKTNQRTKSEEHPSAPSSFSRLIKVRTKEHQNFRFSKQISINCIFCLLCLNIEVNLLFAKAVEFSASALALRSKNIPH